MPNAMTWKGAWVGDGFSTRDDANDVRIQKYNASDYIVVLFWY